MGLRMSAKVNLRIINDLYFSDFKGGEEVINTGWCYIWAWMARLHLKEAKFCTVFTRWNCHAFIKLGDNYYDGEALKGKKNWKNLPFFAVGCSKADRDECELQILTKAQFTNLWREIGKEEWATQNLRRWPRNLNEAFRYEYVP
jgi:hypothetical protein